LTKGVGSTSDPVEEALGYALRAATEAARWELVAQLARELETRRKARRDVVDLAVERERRKR
jgi:hypothetical protein